MRTCTISRSASPVRTMNPWSCAPSTSTGVAGRYQLALFGEPAQHSAVARRDDRGVVPVELGGVQRRLRAIAACVRRSCSCSRLMTLSAYRRSPRAASRCAFSCRLSRLLDLRVDFGLLDFGEASDLCGRARLRKPASLRMTPPTLNARRISSLFASRPLVRIDGAAGPVVAAATRTGVAVGGFARSRCCCSRRRRQRTRGRRTGGRYA